MMVVAATGVGAVVGWEEVGGRRVVGGAGSGGEWSVGGSADAAQRKPGRWQRAAAVVVGGLVITRWCW